LSADPPHIDCLPVRCRPEVALLAIGPKAMQVLKVAEHFDIQIF
jgi:hypothetical protein